MAFTKTKKDTKMDAIVEPQTLGGASVASPITDITLHVPMTNNNFYDSYSNDGKSSKPIRITYGYQISLDEARKIKAELIDAIIYAEKLENYLNS